MDCFRPTMILNSTNSYIQLIHSLIDNLLRSELLPKNSVLRTYSENTRAIRLIVLVGSAI